MKSAAKARTTTQRAIAKFLRALEQRHASAHTITAYSKDLAGFAEFVGSENYIALDHLRIRAYPLNHDVH